MLCEACGLPLDNRTKPTVATIRGTVRHQNCEPEKTIKALADRVQALEDDKNGVLRFKGTEVMTEKFDPLEERVARLERQIAGLLGKP